MKLLNQNYSCYSALMVIAAISITSCASTGIQRSQDTRTTMEAMNNEITSASIQLDATGASLEELMRPGQTDVMQAFEAYRENVEKMEAIEAEFAHHAEQMRAQGIDYFEEWEQEDSEYTNPRIQQLSEQRRAALQEIYARIAENSIGVNEAFKAYVSDIKEIQTFLSNDLTTKGIDAIGPTSEEVVRDGEDLKQAIQDVQTAIQNAQTEMAQSGTN